MILQIEPEDLEVFVLLKEVSRIRDVTNFFGFRLTDLMLRDDDVVLEECILWLDPLADFMVDLPELTGDVCTALYFS